MPITKQIIPENKIQITKKEDTTILKLNLDFFLVCFKSGLMPNKDLRKIQISIIQNGIVNSIGKYCFSQIQA